MEEPRSSATATKRTLTGSYWLGLLRLAGLEYWMVAWTPTWVGWVIAARRAMPDLPAFLLLVTVGPLLTGSTFLFNNLVDRQADRGNPRKAFSLLVQGRIGDRTVLGLYLLLLAGTLLIAGLVGRRFAERTSWEPLALVAAFAGLSIAYSYPGWGLKHRGGADLITNAVGFGLLLPLAGWSLVKPVGDFPPLYLAAIGLTLGALYAPTTVADFAADRVVATHSLAVRFGIRRALMAGFWLLVAGVACIAYLGFTTSYPFFDIRLIQVCVWWLPLQVIAYHHYFWPPGDGSIPPYQRIWRGCIVVATLAALSNLTFLVLFLAWI